MDEKDLQLYHEEQREAYKQLNAGIVSLTELVQKQIDNYIAPSTEVKVSGEVEVNTEKKVEVENLELVKDWLGSVSEVISTAVKENSHKPLSEIKVTNIKEAIPTTIKVTNLKEIKTFFADLAEVIRESQPEITVQKQDIKWPRNPSEAIPVRLTDGKAFYKAIAAMTAAMPEVDPLVGYQICERDDAGSTKYYGYAKANGAWYIMRESASGSYRFFRDTKLTDFATNWTGRAGLTYGYIYEVF